MFEAHADAGPTEEATESIDISAFDIYAGEGYYLTHRYTTDSGEFFTVLDTTEPGSTREIQADGSETRYRTLKASGNRVNLEQVRKMNSTGQCMSSHKTRYEWLATFPSSTRKGEEFQRIARVTDFAYERPCGLPDATQPAVDSLIKVIYTVLGRTAYRYENEESRESVKFDNCVKLSEQAPDYSGIAILCAGVGTAYRLRTGINFGRNERQLIAIDQKPGD